MHTWMQLVLSSALTAAVVAVVGNAFYQKKQFYPSVVYITKSNPSMVVIYIQLIMMVLSLGRIMRRIFLGTLRAAEFEHLMERFWYALTETCLAFTVFRDDFNPTFAATFVVLLFLKSFHWLAEDRVDYMERSPVIGLLFHVRVSSLLLLLGTLDYYMISHAYYSTVTKGPTAQLVFGFEYSILITMVVSTAIKYVLHSAELRAETPWENKAVFLLYTELVMGFVRVILYILFVIIMVKTYTLPLFAFRPMYYTMRNFKKAFNDVILSRRAIRNMNTLYPDATAEELSQSDNICIICREDMVSNAKKLPCGHIFHTACLRSWFQRQQTCPTCRLNILRTPSTPVQPARQAGAAVDPAQNNEQNQPNFPNIQNLNNLPQPNIGIPNLFANNMAPPMHIPVSGNGNTAPNPGGAFIPPLFPLLAPPYLPPPPPPIPPQMDTLTDEELRAIEGNERCHVEERIKLLRNIQLMMDASVALMNQYTVITSRMGPPPPTFLPPNVTPEADNTTNNGSTISTIEIGTNSSTPAASNETSTLNDQPSTSNLPSTSKDSTENRNDTNVAKIVDLGSEEQLDYAEITKSNKLLDQQKPPPIVESSETAELRRRRLQKFLKTEQTE